ncbi:MAG: hypothetical protein KF712_02785 [Akkermansiaceae bacterium]|nr:hypothetical protein [Akkermansiaceae bacterium]
MALALAAAAGLGGGAFAGWSYGHQQRIQKEQASAMLPEISRKLLEALHAGSEINSVAIKVTGGDFSYEFSE